MTAEAEKLLAQSQWRRMGLVTSAPAPAADVELAMERKSRKGVRRKRGEMDRPGVCPSGLARGCEHPTAGFSISTQPGMEPGSVWHVLEAS